VVLEVHHLKSKHQGTHLQDYHIFWTSLLVSTYILLFNMRVQLTHLVGFLATAEAFSIGTFGKRNNAG
jgi:hypothetical protein